MAPVTPANEMVHLAYVNPETGAECLPVLGFSAVMLRPGETAKPARRSASAVMHVIDGDVEAQIDGVTLRAGARDTIAVPTHASIAIANRSAKAPAFLFQVDDAPMQRKLGFYEVFH
jgi:gentisate 1,2-dioxygenase